MREFRTDGSGIWYAYSEESSEWAPKGGVQLVDNDTVYFRGTDAAGNVSEETSFTVSNIDKTPPTKPTVTVTNADLPAGKGVYLTVSFSEDSATKEYSLDGENWQDYQDAILVTEGGKTVFFRGTDAVGNVSDVTRYTVDNRLFAPAAPVAYADITEPTNQDVTVYATFDENAVVRKYAIGNISK